MFFLVAQGTAFERLTDHAERWAKQSGAEVMASKAAKAAKDEEAHIREEWNQVMSRYIIRVAGERVTRPCLSSHERCF